MKKNLSAFAVWGLSFGYAVGWGAFVMPGAVFLPDAGPLGTTLGVLIGAAVMTVIAWNYHKMVSAYPGPAGACRYVHEAFGADYGYLTAWSLSLAYMAILWANATALVLLVRYMFGDVLQFGWHDTLAGFDIYLGEVLLSVAVMVVAGLVCLYGRRLAGRVQAAFAAFMLAAVAVTFFVALSRHDGGLAAMAPAFVPDGGANVTQVLRILAMMPWAFVGFEAVSHSSAEFRFPAKRLFSILLAAIAASVAMYVMLAILPVLSHPVEYPTWTDYIGARIGLSGLDSMPTFAAAQGVLGKWGVALIGAAMFAGIFTGIVAATVAMSRLLYSLSADDVLPKWQWLGKLDGNGSPRNAILFVVGISLVIPFFGRTVIGWPVDVSSIGAAVAYCITSAAAFKFARRNGDVFTRVTGIVGAVMSVVFCLLLLVPNYLAGSVLSAESYLVLALWCIVGFTLYRQVFKHDRFQRFGRSPVVWTGIVILIIFSSLMWVRLSTQNATGRAVDSIVACQARHCAKHHGGANAVALHDEEDFVAGEMAELNDKRLGCDIVQMALLACSLVIMFSLYTIQRRRQEALEVAQAKVAARDRAKSAFLSSISHDIRTPMNAVVGYIELARRAGDDIAKVREYVGKMEASSHHLMALINDVLEMSRIESGKEKLEPVPLDLVTVLREIGDVFSDQMAEKGIRFTVDTSEILHPHVMCDRSRLNRILLNLVSNASKFTLSGGSVTVTMKEEATGNGERGTGNGERGTGNGGNAKAVGSRVPRDRAIYELRVKDTGIGMSPAFLKRVFDPFERERTSSANLTQGTGLGMPITKSLVTLMGGTIDVASVQGSGTEFTVRLPMPQATGGWESAAGKGADAAGAGSAGPNCHADAGSLFPVSGPPKRVLLVEDNDINREIASTLLSQSGFIVDHAENGKAAVEKFAAGGPGFYDCILMDVHMPIMDGCTAARAMRGMERPGGPRVPIIALSANAFESDVKEALAAGMDAHVAKPIKIEALLRTLDETMGKECKVESAKSKADNVANEDASTLNFKPSTLNSLSEMGCDIEATLRDTYVGDRGFYLKMLGKLPGSDALAKMRSSLAAGDAKALFAASHSLKGLYASLGLTPLHALCSEIVEIARPGGTDGAAERLERLEKIHKEVLRIIQEGKA